MRQLNKEIRQGEIALSILNIKDKNHRQKQFIKAYKNRIDLKNRLYSMFTL